MALDRQTRIRRKPGGIEYPDSDGEPMAETDKHRDLTTYVIEALKARYAGQRVYVAGDNFIYFEEGNPKARVSPDAYAVFGVEMRQRNSYKAWEEAGRLPDVVFEFTSKKTRREDMREKVPLYEQRLRIPEYFLFDPTGDYLKPRLQGFRLLEGRYVPLELVDGRLHSEQLRLHLVQDGERLRLYDPDRGEWLLTPLELDGARNAERRRADAEHQRAEAEARAREAAEAETARLKAELEALRRVGGTG